VLVSAPDYSGRRLIDESAWRGRPAILIDFRTINDSHRRDGGRADASHLDPFRDERPSDENHTLFNFLVTFGGLVSERIA